MNKLTLFNGGKSVLRMNRDNHCHVYIKNMGSTDPRVSRFDLVVRRSAGKRMDLGLTVGFSSPFSSQIVVYGHCLVTLP